MTEVVKSQESNTLLNVLKDFPANKIYLMGDRESLSVGYRLYENACVSGFEWANSNATLRTEIDDYDIFNIEISLSGKELEFSCACDEWMSSTLKCEHVICSMFTIKNLLSPNLFITSINNPNRDLLLYGLIPQKNNNDKGTLKNKNIIKGCSIVLEKYEDSISYHVLKNNKPLTNLYNSSIPLELLILHKNSNNHYYHNHGMFLNYLKKHRNRYPLFLRMNGTETPLEWDNSNLYCCKTEFNAVENIISIKRFCHNDDYNVCEHLVLLGSLFAADMESNRLFALPDQDAWHVWEHFNLKTDIYGIRDNSINFDPDNPNIINVPADEFTKSCFIWDKSARKDYLKALNFKCDGKEVSLNKGVVEKCSLTIESDEFEEDSFIIKAEYFYEKKIFKPDELSFDIFIRSESDYFSLFRAKKRKDILFQTVCNLMSAENKTEAKNIIKDTMSDKAVFKSPGIRRQAKDLLKTFHNEFTTKKESLYYSDLTKKWIFVTADNKKGGLLYSIPFSIFGSEIFTDMEDFNVMQIKACDLEDKLPLLYQMCKENNIELFFKDKPVVSVKWEFSFDLAKTSGIDWFELKPEVKCGNAVIDIKKWQDALTKKSVQIKKDSVQIIDINTENMLKAISSMMSTKKKTNKGEIEKVPRLQILDWVSLRNKGVKITLPPEEEKIIQRLLNFTAIKKRRLPKKIDAKLRLYQETGYSWLAFLYENRFGACLADDMGLGKTLQAITLLGAVKEKIVKPPVKIKAPHLIVLPPSLLHNWESEIKKFYPDLSVGFYIGNKRKDNVFKEFDCVLTTYGIVRIDIAKLKEINFNIIIFDEAQAIKNIYAETTGAVRQLRGYFKLATTGTPLENHVGEYYSILDLCIPGLLGDYDKFKAHMKDEKSQHINMLLKRTKPFVLRRTKENVLKELPAKIETDIYLDLTDKQKTLYKNTVKMIKSKIDEAYNEKTAAQAKIIALTAILKLRQLCVSPKLIDPAINEKSPKMDFLLENLKELQEEGHSALVFSQFTSFLDIVGQELTDKGIKFLRLDGSTPTLKRKKLVESFQNEKESAIFLLSLKAGGQGLNLTKASYVFHLDPWWNPAVENQASDRAHRIGQKNKVTIVRILMTHTIEEKMMELKKKKLALYKAVMDDSSDKKKGFSVSKKDFEFLLNA